MDGISPDVLYVVYDEVRNTNSYAVTPDGIGMYWYDTQAEAEAESDLPEHHKIAFVTEKELRIARGEW